VTDAKSEVVSLRFTADEAAELRAQAEACGLALSKHVHACAVDGMRRARPGTWVRQLPSGAELTTFDTTPTAGDAP